MKEQKIRPQDITDYDVIYYNAKQDHDHPKNRPFLIMGNYSDRIIVAPITHTAPSEKIYSRYNLSMNDATQKYITSITKDKDDPKDSYFAAGHVSIIPKNKFYQAHQLPKKLGNLADNVPPKFLKQTVQDIENQCKTIAGDYARGQKLRQEHTDKEIKNNPELTDYAKKHTLSKHDYRKLALSKQEGLKPFFSQQYYPAMDQKLYIQQKKKNNKKQYHRKNKHQEDYLSR